MHAMVLIPIHHTDTIDRDGAVRACAATASKKSKKQQLI
jgi:hypothetical protein